MAGGEKREERKDKRIIVENVRRVLLKEYLMRETQRAGFGGLDIQRTPMGTRVTLIAERPGLVIGRQGVTIKALTSAVERDFSFDNPQIEVQEVSNPSLNAQIMAEKLANALERGWHFRRAGHSTVRRIMEAGAKGCLVIVAGKLRGQRHRTEKFNAGHIKFCGEPRDLFMRNGFAIARMKLGVIGCTVRIMDPAAKLPDEVEVLPAKPAVPAQAPTVAVAAEPEAEAAPVTEEPAPEAAVAPAAAATKPVRIPARKERVHKSKLAEKRLKKVRKEAKELADEVDVDVPESDEDGAEEGSGEGEE